MMVLLPLSLTGIGAFIYFLFNVASHALLLAIAVAAALACAHVGASIPVALLVGFIDVILVTGLVCDRRRKRDPGLSEATTGNALKVGVIDETCV